ncbi:cAMP-dependent protein kinase catalytic subunit [Ophiocordyceps camponoti-floridani]|uniref:cAMP-dependent protein kinase n=1 Tax=Ophiocordyceps camponoti-floridani TaxID=2030778 RepID=A0A8H4Q6W3_9HYPO|nr:cAMP-dependent protein kinase catalytic subunit [Ophiocordyceps camponoti-floridani]
MPSLGGFLKKKRTRDSNPESSNPTSPVAASSPVRSLFDAGTTSPSTSTSTTTTTTLTKTEEAVHMSPAALHPSSTTTTTTTHHNLPSIRNLIHQPQHDGVAVAAPPSSSHYRSSSPKPVMKQQDAQPAANGAADSQPQTARVTKGKYSLVDFDILRTLGTGSFGRVHLVQSKHNQRYYAVKVLKKAQVVKMKQVEHTNDERRMLSYVKHPFLITLWGTFQDCRNLYMVMDFVEGGELFSLLRKSGRFPNPVAKFYAAEVTLALEYLHSKNIIYRDLKPENLLLDRHGHVKITDFGFAKLVPDKTWTLCGTPDYLAPEVVSNRGYNKSVDWWSLGILIYEMLCGYTPFWDSGSPMRIYENILKGKVKYPAYVNADAQNLLEGLITADLTKRLGNLYAGSQDIKGHPWFAEVTWDRLARKDIDAPYTPPVKAGAGDSSQFDKYPEDPDEYGHANDVDELGYLFTDF